MEPSRGLSLPSINVDLWYGQLNFGLAKVETPKSATGRRGSCWELS